MQADTASGDPFAILTLIVAPAILTNASALLSLSTSNRLARATDRTREVGQRLMDPGAAEDPLTPVRLRQLERLQRRSVLLLSALRLFYLALGFFAATAIVSLLGAAAQRMAQSESRALLQIMLWLSAASGSVAVASIIAGCTLLLRETGLAVQNIQDEAAVVEAQHRKVLDRAR